MKRSLLVLTPLVALVLCTGAYAQGGRYISLDDNRTSTLDVDFSGEIDLNWAYQNNVIREAAGVGATTLGGWAIGGSQAADNAGANSRESADFFWGRLTLRMQAHIADNVHGYLELETQNFDAGVLSPFGNSAGPAGAGSEDSSLVPQIEQMYVDINQLWSDHISLRLGLQDVVIDLRGSDRSGGAFVFDLTESESAWHGINALGPVTFRDTMEPLGVRFRYEDIAESNVDFKLWLLPVIGNEDAGGDPADEDEAGYIANLDWYLPDIGENSKLMVILAYMLGGDAGVNGLTGTGRDMNVLTFGLGIDIRGIGDPGVELYAEGYIQNGSAGRAIGPNAGTKLDAEGYAFNVGFRYEALDTRGHPWFELGYVFVRGDDGISATDGNYEGFISYENVDDFAIIEGNELGLDIDTNYSAFKIKGGLRFSSEHGQDNIHLDLKAGFFQFDQDVPYATAFPLANGVTGPEDDLGVEIDASLTYHFNDQLTFDILVAFLTGADALKAFTAGADDDSWLLNIGMNLKF